VILRRQFSGAQAIRRSCGIRVITRPSWSRCTDR